MPGRQSDQQETKRAIATAQAWINGAVKRHHSALVLLVCLTALMQVLALALPLFFQIVVDKVLVHSGATTLNALFVGLIIILLFEGLVSQLRGSATNHAVSRIEVQLSGELFAHLLTLPQQTSRRIGASGLIARFKQLDVVRARIASGGLLPWLDVIFLVFVLAVMALFSVGLTLLVIGLLSVAVIVLWFTQPNGQAAQEANLSANQHFTEVVAGAETVRRLGAGPDFAKRWQAVIAKKARLMGATSQSSAQQQQLIQLCGKALLALILFLGAQRVMAGEMTVGQLIAFNLLTAQLLQPLSRFVRLHGDNKRYKAALADLGQLLEEVGESDATTQASAASLPAVRGEMALKDVSFGHKDAVTSQPLLENVSLVLTPGEVVAITGPSGTGKSTIGALIQRQAAPTGGQLTLDGLPIEQFPIDAYRRAVALVTSDAQLFAGSVRENIALALPDTPMARVIRAAEIVGAHDFIIGLPGGYDCQIGGSMSGTGIALSGGQRQRLALARALVTNPRVMILDEATSALDPASERSVLQHIKQAAPDRALLIIGHRVTALEGADRLLLLHERKLQAVAPRTLNTSTTSTTASQSPAQEFSA